MDHQNKLNYTNELDRIRDICLKVISRFPIGTKQRLAHRAFELKKLRAQIIDMN
jgi:hypothetical protein